MITFNNLAFVRHPEAATLSVFRKAIQAVILFDNGYGVSVVTGAEGLYGNVEEETYEVAAIKGTSLKWELVYPKGTSFEMDVLGYKTPEEITELMAELQKLPSCN